MEYLKIITATIQNNIELNEDEETVATDDCHDGYHSINFNSFKNCHCYYVYAQNSAISFDSLIALK